MSFLVSAEFCDTNLKKFGKCFKGWYPNITDPFLIITDRICGATCGGKCKSLADESKFEDIPLFFYYSFGCKICSVGL